MSELIKLPKRYSHGVKHNPIRDIKYAIGIQSNEHELGMIHGPVSNIMDMLNIIGFDNQHIIRFNSDETDDILYSWDTDNGEWVLNDKLIGDYSLNGEI